MQTTEVGQRVVERITPILRKAAQAAMVEQVARSFEAPDTVAPPEPAAAPVPIAVPSREVEVVTTEDELRCMRAIEAWVRDTRPEAPLTGRDSRSYFTVHQNNVRRWFVRFNVQRQPFWIAFRHVLPDELRAGLQDGSVSDGGQLGDSKLALKEPAVLEVLRPYVLMAYEREAKRVESGEG